MSEVVPLIRPPTTTKQEAQQNGRAHYDSVARGRVPGPQPGRQAATPPASSSTGLVPATSSDPAKGGGSGEEEIVAELVVKEETDADGSTTRFYWDEEASAWIR